MHRDPQQAGEHADAGDQQEEEAVLAGGEAEAAGEREVERLEGLAQPLEEGGEARAHGREGIR